MSTCCTSCGASCAASAAVCAACGASMAGVMAAEAAAARRSGEPITRPSLTKIFVTPALLGALAIVIAIVALRQ